MIIMVCLVLLDAMLQDDRSAVRYAKFSDSEGNMVSMLLIQDKNKTTWTKIQGKIKDHGSEFRKLNFCE